MKYLAETLRLQKKNLWRTYFAIVVKKCWDYTTCKIMKILFESETKIQFQSWIYGKKLLTYKQPPEKKRNVLPDSIGHQLL